MLESFRQNYCEGRRVPPLDGLRGVAILLVILVHYKGLQPELLSSVLSFGWIGVDLFFVLSGFLITGILIDQKGSPGYFKNFYARRTLRIFPLYYGVLVTTFLVLPMFGIVRWDVPFEVQWPYWVYLNNYMTLPQFGGQEFSIGFSPFWSLAVEEQYYLLWPFVVFATPRNRMVFVFSAIIVFVFLLRAGLVFASNEGLAYVSLFTRADSLTAGALLSCLLKRDGFVVNLTGTMIAMVVASLATCGLCYFVGSWRAEIAPTMQLVGYSLFAFVFAMTIKLAVCLPKASFFVRLCELRFLMFFGKYSYAMYIFHQLVQESVRAVAQSSYPKTRDGMEFEIDMVSLVLTTALSVASWHLLEKRFLALKRHFQ